MREDGWAELSFNIGIMGASDKLRIILILK